MPRERHFSSEAWAEHKAAVQERPALVTQDSSHEELVRGLAAETVQWPKTGTSADETVRAAFRLVCEAPGGVLMMVGPRTTLRRLRENCNPAGANVTKQMRGLSIWDEEFRRLFFSFTTPSADRQPMGKHDGKACQTQAQDAVLLVAGGGDIMMCSTAVVGLPAAPLVWPGYGRRHTAALEVASFLDRVVVIVRSDGGAIHALARRADNIVMAWRLQGRVVVTSSVEDQSRRDSKAKSGSRRTSPLSSAVSPPSWGRAAQSSIRFCKDEQLGIQRKPSSTFDRQHLPVYLGARSSQTSEQYPSSLPLSFTLPRSLGTTGNPCQKNGKGYPSSKRAHAPTGESSTASPVVSKYVQCSKPNVSVDIDEHPITAEHQNSSREEKGRQGVAWGRPARYRTGG